MKSKSRGIQFWTLMLVSSVVSLMLVRQIFLSYAIIKEQGILVDAHETADSDDVYQKAWQQLAMTVYRAGPQDPAMAALLKSEGIGVHEGPPPGSAGAATNAAPVPAAASKPVQAQASHPPTP